MSKEVEATRLLVETYGITSSTQLVDLSKKFKFKLNFVGFTDDLSPEKVKSDLTTRDNRSCSLAYIFNIGDTAGTHWTAAYIKDDVMFYFDSFAVPPEDDLIQILEKSNTINLQSKPETSFLKKIIYNSNFQFQNICENLCGIWYVIFLYHMSHSKLPSLIERFDEFKKMYKNVNA